MDVSPSGLMALVRDTLSDPRSAARRIMAVELTLGERWMALAFTVVGSTLLFHLGLALLPPGTVGPTLPPVGILVLQWATLFVAIQLIWRLGRRRGGQGSLPDTVSLMAWLQFVLLLLQAAQLVAEVILPPLAVMIGIAGVALFFWLLSHFVAELHGFASPLRVFVGIVGVLFLAAFLLAFVLTFVLAPMLGLPVGP